MKLLTFICCFSFVLTINAQVGIGTTTPHASSSLDIESSDSGLLIPRMTRANRLLIPIPATAEGLLVYQTDWVKGFYYFDGTAWQTFGGGGSDLDWIASGTDQYSGFTGNVGIGATVPSEKLHVQGGVRITDLSGTGTRMVVTNATGVLSSQAITVGDITSVTAGDGLNGGGTAGDLTLNVSVGNGLHLDSDEVHWGGTLEENTTITHAGFISTHNLNGTGDFIIQDNGTNKFELRDNGNGYFGGDVYWKDENTIGTNLMRLIDGGDGNDGELSIYTNGTANHIIRGAGETVFNELSTNVDFRVESNGDANMLFVDGGTNRVGIGTGTLTQTLDIDGNTDVNSGTYYLKDIAGETYGIGYATEGGSQMTIFSDQYIDITESDGDLGTMHFDVNNREVGIRTTAPTRALDVNGTVRIRGGGPTAGEFLMSQDGNGNAIWSGTGYGLVPIGSIVAWHGNMGNVPALPAGWVECVGGTVNDAASPMNGRPIPNLNNATTSESGDASRGRFLRGNTTSGNFQGETTNNFHRYEQDDDDGGPNTVVEAIDDDGQWTQWVGDYHADDRKRFQVAGTETRVTNMSVRWIIRIK